MKYDGTSYKQGTQCNTLSVILHFFIKACVVTHHFTFFSSEVQLELSDAVIRGHSEPFKGVAQQWFWDGAVLCIRHHREALFIVDNQPAVQTLIQTACTRRDETRFKSRNTKTGSHLFGIMKHWVFLKLCTLLNKRNPQDLFFSQNKVHSKWLDFCDIRPFMHLHSGFETDYSFKVH